ncbi:hypothetical protein [Cyanobium sp. NIES-981]|uniref:hypothetical protein n=1 Tax=Cyanobium sp. NIES-981 TaxID=1851505 RepID=UPI00155F5FCE|nr:hypothetical protein [Cyanobium sp. NIES-981]
MVLAVLENRKDQRSRQADPARGLSLDQRLERQEAAVAAILLRFDRLELELERLQRQMGAPRGEAPTAAGQRPDQSPSPESDRTPARRPQAREAAEREAGEQPAPARRPPPPLRPEPRREPPPPQPPPPQTRPQPPPHTHPQPAPPPPPPPLGPQAVRAAAPPRAPGPWQQRWRRWEQLLIANWTGLLGVVVVVAGVTFAAINVALQFNPWQRFLLVVAAATAMALPSLLLKPASPWLRLSRWLRSGGAALLLFACTAAGGLPQLGLQWLDDPGQSLALLGAAIAVNLVLAAVATNQTVAGLHVVVCLVPLTIVPQGGLILAVASLVALVGVVLPLARPWYGHRLLVGLSYGLFHANWVVRTLPLLAGSDTLRNQAALAAALVFISGTVLLQRPQRLRQHGLTLPLLVQLVNSGGLALALLLEPPQLGSRALALAACAGLLAVLAVRARRAELSWLRRCDVILAQAFSLAALLSLGPWVANPTLLTALVLLECLALLHLGHQDPDTMVRQLGWWLSLLAGLALAAVTLGAAPPGQAPPLQNSAVLLVSGALALASQHRVHRPKALPGAGGMGWIGALLLWLGSSVIPPDAWQPWLTVTVLTAALLSARHWQLPGGAQGLAAMITLIHIGSWIRLLNQVPWAPQSLAALTLPPLLLALLLLCDRRHDVPRATGWWLLCLSGGFWGQMTLLVRLGVVGPERLAGHAVLLLAGGALLVAVQLGMMRWRLRAPWPELMGWLGPGLLLLGSLGCLPRPWPEPIATALLQLSLLVGLWRRPPGLVAGTTAATGVLLAGSWVWLLAPQSWSWQELLPRLLPLVLVVQILWLRGARAPRRGAWILLNGTAVALLLSALLAWAVGPEVIRSRAATLLIAGQLIPVLHGRLQRTGIPQLLPPALAWQGAALTYAGVALGLPAPWRGIGGLLAFGGLLLLARQWRPSGLHAAAACGVTALHLQLWLQLLLQQPCPAQEVLQILLPLAALALLQRLADRPGPDSGVGGLNPLPIYLIGSGAGLASWLLLAPVSPLIPPVAWLLLALLALELTSRLPMADGRHALICAVGLLLAFACGYGLVISQSPVLLELGGLTLPGRFAIELLAMAVFLYWWFLPSSSRLTGLALWNRLHPLLLEALVLGTVVTVLSEVEVFWRPVAWAGLALLVILRPIRRLFAARLQIYAVLLYWLSLATLLAVLSTLQTPAQAWILQPGQIALLAMGLQVGFILVTHRQLDVEQLSSSRAWGPLGWIGRRISRRPHRWIYLPLFAVVTYYLWLRYDRALLTLLWTTEAFVIYGLSAVLRDGKFRLLALIALGACLLRLVAIDMAQADLGIRGAVFIGVGLLMVGMNALYNRFRNRFESGPEASAATGGGEDAEPPLGPGP